MPLKNLKKYIWGLSGPKLFFYQPYLVKISEINYSELKYHIKTNEWRESTYVVNSDMEKALEYGRKTH